MDKVGVFSLKHPGSGLPKSKWNFGYSGNTNTGSYVPLCPAESTNEQSIDGSPVLPTAANTYLFCRQFRDRIVKNRHGLSRNPEDWYLTKLDLITHEGQGVQVSDSDTLTREAPVKLTFEVQRPRLSKTASISLHAFQSWVDLVGPLIDPAIE